MRNFYSTSFFPTSAFAEAPCSNAIIASDDLSIVSPSQEIQVDCQNRPYGKRFIVNFSISGFSSSAPILSLHPIVMGTGIFAITPVEEWCSDVNGDFKLEFFVDCRSAASEAKFTVHSGAVYSDMVSVNILH